MVKGSKFKQTERVMLYKMKITMMAMNTYSQLL